jgi:PilZ domain-containing protein
MARELVYDSDVTEDDPTRRREPRDSVMLSATIRHEHGGEFTARVRNISAGGIKIDCPRGLPGGTPVEVALRGVGVVRGIVAWSAGGLVGIRFEATIDPRLTMPQINVRKDGAAPVNPGDFRRPGLKLSDD